LNKVKNDSPVVALESFGCFIERSDKRYGNYDPNTKGSSDALPGLPCDVSQPIDVCQDGLCFRKQHFSHVGQFNALTRSVKKLDFQVTFQNLNSLGERRLADVKPRRGTAEMALLRDGDEACQLFQGDIRGHDYFTAPNESSCYDVLLYIIVPSAYNLTVNVTS
jgi:hypothetical protein